MTLPSDNRINLTSKAEILKSFNEMFYFYSRITNLTFGSNDVYNYDALRLLEGLKYTWKKLYESLEDYREQMFKENLYLFQKVAQLNEKAYFTSQRFRANFWLKRANFSSFMNNMTSTEAESRICKNISRLLRRIYTETIHPSQSTWRI